MAKFHSYYVLCPLIDQKSFLGVTENRENENIIVTLGRNVVNKYRLSDQKQIAGWTSKDHITSAIIYDKEKQCYAGIFNKNTIKMWTSEEDNLDKLKKYKFSANISKLIPFVNGSNKTSIIIFENGNCASLTYGIDNRKTFEVKSFIKDTDILVDVIAYSVKNKDYICHVVKNQKGRYEIINCPLRDELGDLEMAKLNRVKVTRTEQQFVVGYLLSAHNYQVYFLWNDSKMTAYNLLSKSWNTVGTVPWINTQSGVSLAWMGESHLILFGSNLDQDGAIIVAYNTVLGVGSCRYPMKMYTEGAKLYCFNGRIILEASNHIGMLPYILETDRNLSSLLGSHDITLDNSTEIADWDSPVDLLFKVNDDLRDLLKVGISERSICAQTIPPLLENNDFRIVFRTIKEFTDIPESILILVLKYSINIINPDNIDVMNEELFTNLCQCKKDSKKEVIMSKARFELLNYVLQISFSDALIIPYIKNSLTLDEVLFLMTYIGYLLMESDKIFHYESKLYDWCALLIDSFYQQYVMTNDVKVAYVLEKTRAVVTNLTEKLYSINSIMPSLNKLVNGKPVSEPKDKTSYSIEILKI
ncbi:nucleolar protein 11 [Leptidea sinapis]|uniref:nucleolar protein 11 n=1 Tax=Leptidea sinapis TaxID=189913 RepID=UPI00213A6F2B|nr:nucleolar protein 11 [Leptidea sinapis]